MAGCKDRWGRMALWPTLLLSSKQTQTIHFISIEEKSLNPILTQIQKRRKKKEEKTRQERKASRENPPRCLSSLTIDHFLSRHRINLSVLVHEPFRQLIRHLCPALPTPKEKKRKEKMSGIQTDRLHKRGGERRTSWKDWTNSWTLAMHNFLISPESISPFR